VKDTSQGLRPAPPAAIRVSRTPPPGLAAIHLPRADRELMERVAIDVWTAMINQGRSLQDAILAVYLSGINHGAGAAADARKLADLPEFSPEFSPATISGPASTS
jgi:hypothetical protein